MFRNDVSHNFSFLRSWHGVAVIVSKHIIRYARVFAHQVQFGTPSNDAEKFKKEDLVGFAAKISTTPTNFSRNANNFPTLQLRLNPTAASRANISVFAVF